MVDNQYILGENVTQAAGRKERRDTTVISVRLSNNEVARLEQLGVTNGKTVSQIVREAISAYNVKQHDVIWSLPNGSVVAYGAPQAGTFGYSSSEQQPPDDISTAIITYDTAQV